MLLRRTVVVALALAAASLAACADPTAPAARSTPAADAASPALLAPMPIEDSTRTQEATSTSDTSGCRSEWQGSATRC